MPNSQPHPYRRFGIIGVLIGALVLIVTACGSQGQGVSALSARQIVTTTSFSTTTSPAPPDVEVYCPKPSPSQYPGQTTVPDKPCDVITTTVPETPAYTVPMTSSPAYTVPDTTPYTTEPPFTIPVLTDPPTPECQSTNSSGFATGGGAGVNAVFHECIWEIYYRAAIQHTLDFGTPEDSYTQVVLHACGLWFTFPNEMGMEANYPELHQAMTILRSDYRLYLSQLSPRPKDATTTLDEWVQGVCD